jgi:hypothetical protein
MFQWDIREVVWPNYTIKVARYRDNKARFAELLYGTFDDLANLKICNLKNFLLKNGWTQGQLQQAVEQAMAYHAGPVCGANFPGS